MDDSPFTDRNSVNEADKYLGLLIELKECILIELGPEDSTKFTPEELAAQMVYWVVFTSCLHLFITSKLPGPLEIWKNFNEPILKMMKGNFIMRLFLL